MDKLGTIHAAGLRFVHFPAVALWPETSGATWTHLDNAPGVSDTEIKIGNTNPYSGPASVYSTIGKSIGACFNEVNDNGGINGRKIKWISYDDGYSPPKTKEQIRKLLDEK